MVPHHPALDFHKTANHFAVLICILYGTSFLVVTFIPFHLEDVDPIKVKSRIILHIRVLDWNFKVTAYNMRIFNGGGRSRIFVSVACADIGTVLGRIDSVDPRVIPEREQRRS